MAGFSLNKVIDFCNLSRRFCKDCFKKYKHDYTEDEKNKEYCCFCCCECSDYKREEYKKNKEFFCYCYQAKRKQTWFNKFLTSDIQKTILPYMVEYFVLQLLFIAFEKQYFSFSAKNESTLPSNNNTNPNNSLNFLENYFFSYNSNETNNDTETNDNKSNFIRIDDLYTFLVFVLTFFLFFYFTLTFNTIVHFNDDLEETIFGIKNKDPTLGINKLSNGILDGTHGILIFDALFAFIFSAIYLYNSEHYIFTKNNFFMVPILMNKFYYFTLIYYCISYSEKKKQFELISGSTLISIYLFIWETIASLIRDYIPLYPLYIIQFILSILPCFVPLFLYLRPLIKILIEPYFDCKWKFSLFFSFLCCYCSFILCLGGFWCNAKCFRYTRECMGNLYKCFCDYCSCCSCDCKDSSECECCRCCKC